MNKAKVVADPNSESGFSLVFPEGIIESIGWNIGDEIIIKMDENGKIILMKKE